MRVLGLDGWKSGWLGVFFDGSITEIADFSALGEVAGVEVDAIVVDVPIGLPVEGRRQADAEARRFVKPRHSSVFTTPPELPLRAPTYALARSICVEHFGFSLSSQAYRLGPKILEAQGEVEQGIPFVEGHPEVSFRAMAGEPLRFSKRTWNGQQWRRSLLAKVGIVIPDVIDGRSGSAPPDDVLDAGAMAWTAWRLAHGDAQTLPDPPENLGGRQVAIWY